MTKNNFLLVCLVAALGWGSTWVLEAKKATPVKVVVAVNRDLQNDRLNTLDHSIQRTVGWLLSYIRTPLAKYAAANFKVALDKQKNPILKNGVITNIINSRSPNDGEKRLLSQYSNTLVSVIRDEQLLNKLIQGERINPAYKQLFTEALVYFVLPEPAPQIRFYLIDPMLGNVKKVNMYDRKVGKNVVQWTYPSDSAVVSKWNARSEWKQTT